MTNWRSVQTLAAPSTPGLIQSGNKRILGKANPIYSLQIHDGLRYTRSTPSARRHLAQLHERRHDTLRHEQPS